MMRNTLKLRLAGLGLAIGLLAGCGGDSPDALVASAKDYLAKNDRKAAVIQLKNALQKSPEMAEARFLLGKALLETGDIPAAEKELRKARELNYPADQVLPLLGRAMVQLGEFKKVVDDLGKAEVASPEAKAAIQTELGQAQLALGNVEAATAAFAAAVAAKADHPPAVLGQARLKAGGGDLPGSLTMVEGALAKSPELYEGWQLKGDILLAQGKPDEALAAYRKALEVKKDYLLAHAQIILLLGGQNKLDEAGKQLEEMKKVAPKHPQTLYLQALLAYRQKNLAAAREAMQEQLRVAPDNLPGLLLAGTIEYELKSYTQAESYLSKVVARAPNALAARRLLTLSYLRSQRPDLALETLKPALAGIEKNSDMLALAGEVFLQNGEAAEAAKYFEKSAALDPQSAGKKTAVALSHFAKGESDRAFKELEDIAAGDSASTSADLPLIAGYLQKREYDKALKAIDALQKKQPDNPLVYNLRGGALLAKRDVPGARKNFEKAIELNPTYFAAAANLARLDLAERKPDDARKRFEAILTKDPKHMQSLLALAELRNQQGAPADEVIALVRKAVETNPTQSAPRLFLIAHYLRRNDAKAAMAAAQDAVAALPDRPELLDAAGRAQQAAGDLNQAVATYNKLAGLQPNSPAPLLRVAEIQVAAKDNDAAIQTLRKALTLKPDLLEAQRPLILLLLGKGENEQALSMAREVQKQRPKESVGYVFEGDIHASKKAWEQALAAYRNGLKQVGTADLAIKVHAALGASGSAAEADKFAAAWQKDHPKDAAFRIYLAELATARKDYAGAVAMYKGLLEQQPKNAVLLNNLAWNAGQLKDPRALEYAEKANELSPNQPAILDTLGVLLVEKGDTARGVELLQKASSLAPQAGAVRLNLAKALIKAGQKDAAKKELDTLAQLGDKFPAQKEVAELMKGL